MTTVWVAGVALFVVYAALCAVLYSRQADFLFFRVPSDPQLAAEWRARRITIPGEVAIEGWWAEHPAVDNDLTLLYFGGNAEDVLYALSDAHRFRARRMLACNYRGYGGTPGVPSETALLKDALTIYDYVARQPGLAADRIVLVGRSLGSGVATYLAAHRPVRGVVLITPYDSMTRVASHHYPYLPVAWLLKHRFASIDWAPRIDAPVLMLAAEHDHIVPPGHAQRLFAVWRGPKHIHILPNVGHNDVDAAPDYERRFNEFLDGLN